MTEIKRVPAMAAALVALGLVAGCGGSASDAAAASGAGGSGSSQSERSTKAMKYAECMRENGVPSFPDPNPDGGMAIRATPGGDLNPNSPQFQAAEEKCKSLAPPGLQPGSPQSNQAQSQMLKYAECMRENGVPSFPDPQNGRMIIRPGDGLDPNSPQFQAARQACQKLAPGGVQ